MNIDDCFRKGLLKRSCFPDNIIGKEIENSKKHLKNAYQCIRDGMLDLAVVSVYTAMFHAARAILFKDGIKERSHICVMIYLKEKYPELSEYTTILDTYRRSRHTMLYGIDIKVIEDDAKLGIEQAEKFINKIEKEVINKKIDDFE